jgi:hypothetical protein
LKKIILGVFSQIRLDTLFHKFIGIFLLKMESKIFIKPYIDCGRSQLAEKLYNRIKKHGFDLSEEKQTDLLNNAIRSGDMHVIITILQHNSMIEITEKMLKSFNLDNKSKPQYKGKFNNISKDTKQKVEIIQKFYKRRQLELELSKKLAQRIREYNPCYSFSNKQQYFRYINDIIDLLQKGADYEEYDDYYDSDDYDDYLDNLCIKILKLNDQKLSSRTINFLINRNDANMITQLYHNNLLLFNDYKKSLISINNTQLIRDLYYTDQLSLDDYKKFLIGIDYIMMIDELYNKNKVSLQEYNWLRRRSYLIFLSSLIIVDVHKIFSIHDIQKVIVSFL